MFSKQKSEKGISVIIPTFNRAKYLYATLICLCNQKTDNFNDYEIVVIDSGDDETGTVVEKIRQTSIVNIIYKKIRNCENRSLLRNTGIKFSNYEILVFLDNDMLVPPDFIRKVFFAQQNNEKQVLLGYRKLLTAFSLDAIGEETLHDNFSIIDQLPYYKDERLEKDVTIEPWRFVFSHTMSVHKSVMNEIRGFDKTFGQQWGLEDIELGVRLAKSGCSFAYLEDCFTYHQPHFKQSSSEQRKAEPNRRLLAKLHNSFEVELMLEFYQQYEKIFPVVKDLHLTESCHTKGKIKFDLILARVHSMYDSKVFANERLGVYIPAENGVYKNVLISKEFYKMPETIQRAILAEAYRTSVNVYYEDCTEERQELVKKICFDINNVLHIEKADGYIKTNKNKDSHKTAINCVLPDILNSEKRVIYQWVLNRLKKNGEIVNIQDTRKERTFLDDDFSLPKEYLAEIDPLINTEYGNIPYRTVNSLFYLHSQTLDSAENSIESFVFHDDECIYSSQYLIRRKYENCVHFDETCYNLLSFACIEDLSHLYKSSATDVNKAKSFCCFMNNSFYDDGIDLILESFATYKKNNPEATLSIRTIDIKETVKNCYPLHNEASKKNKVYSADYKYSNDVLLLQNTIEQLGLTKNVTVIKKKMSLLDSFEFIDSHSTLIFAARTCCVPPQVFISILLKKNTIIASHHSLMQPFDDCCVKVDSEIKPFAEELRVPKTINNIFLSLGKIDTNKLVSAFDEKAKNILEPKSIDQLLKCGNDIYEKVKTIPCRV